MSKFIYPYVDFPKQHKPINKKLHGALDKILESGNFILGEELERFEEETVDYLKSKFPEIYKLIIEEIKKDPTVIDPVAEVTPGRFVDHIGDRGEELLKEYEAILKKCARM